MNRVYEKWINKFSFDDGTIIKTLQPWLQTRYPDAIDDIFYCHEFITKRRSDNFSIALTFPVAIYYDQCPSSRAHPIRHLCHNPRCARPQHLLTEAKKFNDADRHCLYQLQNSSPDQLIQCASSTPCLSCVNPWGQSILDCK
ncbi:hypothetical protein QOT17_018825 [Balamuthia mandrillaris]